MSLDRLQKMHDAGLYLRARNGEPMAKEAWMSAAGKLGLKGLGGLSKAVGWAFQPGKISRRALPIGMGVLGGGSAIAGGVQAAKQTKVQRPGPPRPTYAT